jgi:hypothetical protein
MAVFNSGQLELTSEVLDTRVRFDTNTLANALLALHNEGGRMKGLTENLVTDKIMGPLTCFGLFALSLGEKDRKRGVGKDGTLVGWSTLKYTCQSMMPHEGGAGDTDLVLEDTEEEVFAICEMKTPKCALSEQWVVPYALLGPKHAKYKCMIQVSDFIMWLVYGLNGMKQAGEAAFMKSHRLKSKREYVEKFGGVPPPSRVEYKAEELEEEVEVTEMLLLLPIDDDEEEEDVQLKFGGMPLALASFPSHLFVGLMRDDGVLCMGKEDLMEGLWRETNPGGCESLLIMAVSEHGLNDE